MAVVFLFVLAVNSFVILFTGKYWDTAHTFYLGMIRLGTKVTLFVLGLTDKYPGFNLGTNGIFELNIDKPKAPNRWLSFPLFGFLIRFIVLLPYSIFARVMENGSFAAMAVSWFAVLLNGKYPESLYEFERDAIRVGLADPCYLVSLSDRYPSFKISWNHKNVKIALLIAGILLTILNVKNYYSGQRHDTYEFQYNNDSFGP